MIHVAVRSAVGMIFINKASVYFRLMNMKDFHCLHYYHVTIVGHYITVFCILWCSV